MPLVGWLLQLHLMILTGQVENVIHAVGEEGKVIGRAHSAGVPISDRFNDTAL